MSQNPVTLIDQAGISQSFSEAVDAAGDLLPKVCLDSSMPTYRASAQFTPYATSAVTLISIQGAAGKTVRVRRIAMSGHSTANAQESIALQRSSALGTGGTAVPPTAAKLDPNDAAPNATVKHYTTAAQSAGTGVGGPLATKDVLTGVVTTPTIVVKETMLFPEEGAPIGKSIVLRGASDFLEVKNINGGNLSAGTVLNYTVEWEEDNS